MKTKIILIFFLFVSIECFSQQWIQPKDVPDSVKATFKRMYPKLTTYRWFKNYFNYEAHFTVIEGKKFISFDDTGKFLDAETEMILKSIPKTITDVITKDLQKKYQLISSTKYEGYGLIKYMVEISFLNKKWEYVIDEKGQLISKDEVKE